ncbi:IclR family transcriptional regulator [Nitratireductor pacificus pht-3B]|uniref:IclR family transcriptional regulator n=2 Tax=Nitratireductor TaxID=245876 RepID=K2M8Z3_9HYPH|nr:IclR family transcriptional regulator [Nitratireductor pacificus pht-3B]
MDAEGERDPLFVGSVAKALRVLQAFREADRELSLAEISDLSGLGRSAAQRFCHTLLLLGYLEKDPRSRHLRLSARVLDLAYSFLSSNPFLAVASRFVLAAHEASGHAFNLGQPIDADMMYVVRLPSLHAAITSPLVGGRAPMYCTASGRSYLSALPGEESDFLIEHSTLDAITPHTMTDRGAIRARLDVIREKGYEVANQECVMGELTVASPVLGRGRQALGSVNLCVTTREWTIERVEEELSPIITQLANEISRALGASPSA